MQFGVLGPLAVIDVPSAEPERPAQRRLLGILLMEADRPVDTDVLIDRFWSEDPPRTARAALQTHVAALRRRLGDDLIETTPAGYRLRLGTHVLDRVAFERTARIARQSSSDGAWEEAADAAESALRLWRGEPYVELAGDDFAQPEIARLEELRIELEELRAHALLALGRGEQALPDLEAVTAEHPIRERLTELIMLARTRAGQPTQALEAYHRLRTLLSEMGLEPSPQLRELEERILREDPTLVPPRIHHNLPKPGTRFIGRRAEARELSAMLGEHRLVTVTGAGGTGKTRLSVEVAHRALHRFPDGVYLVRLGGLVDAQLVMTEVGAALGLRVEGQPTLAAITEALAGRRVLLILDNCEHLIDACAEVAMAVADGRPGPVVLATSREALGVAGERIFEVQPLATPGDDVVGPEAITAYDAVRLFVDRATLADPAFRLDSASAGHVVRICRRLDGLPLAIELAAARVRALAVSTIAANLEDRFGFAMLSGRHGPERRQRTLEAAIDWSYQLLDDRQRVLFMRLAVFRAGFDLEALTEICSDGQLPRGEVAALLARLVEQSLVVREATADADRYRLLETVRRFAWTRLDLAGNGDEMARRHRQWYLGLAVEANRHLEDADQAIWLERVGRDRENLDAALDSAVSHGDAGAAATVAEALAWYHGRLGQHARAITEMGIALGHLDTAVEPERAAEILVRLAGARYGSGDEPGALAAAGRACDLVVDRSPSRAKVRALSELASLHLRIVQSDPAPAIDASQDAVSAARAMGDGYAESHALRTLGTALCWAGSVQDGIAALRHALAISVAIDNPTAILGVYMRLYISLLDFARDDEAAGKAADEALRWLQRDSSRWGQSANLLMWFAYGFLRAGQWRRTEELLDQSADYHIEGMSTMSYHAVRGILRWMQGRLTEADTEARMLRATDPRPRYFRLLYPLEAEVAAEEGRLDDVRHLVQEHLETRVIRAEEATKAGSLRALVRAEMDAAMAAPAVAREHRRRAEAAMREIRRLVDEFPTESLSGIQLELPPTYRALAEAEMARGTTGAADAWEAIADRPLFAYWRAYAHWRLGESLLADGRSDDGNIALRTARHEAESMGAHLLRGRIDATAGEAGIALTPSGPPGETPRTPRGGRTAP